MLKKNAPSTLLAFLLVSPRGIWQKLQKFCLALFSNWYDRAKQNVDTGQSTFVHIMSMFLDIIWTHIL